MSTRRRSQIASKQRLKVRRSAVHHTLGKLGDHISWFDVRDEVAALARSGTRWPV
jgi:hypothetical protein